MSDAIAPTEWNLDTYRDLLTRVLALKIRERKETAGEADSSRDSAEFLRYLQWEINGLCIALRLTNDERAAPHMWPIPMNKGFDEAWAESIEPPPEGWDGFI